MGCYTNGAKTKCNETTQNAPCSPCDTECPEGIWKTSCIVYTGPDQPDIDVVTNDELNVVIANINDAIAAAAACSFTLTPGSNILIEGASTPVVVECGDDITISTDPCGFTTLNTTVQYNNGAAPCGVFILKQNLTASINNLMLGYGADSNPTGANNTFLGINAGNLTSGASNVCVGENAGTAMTTAATNTLIGKNSGVLLTIGAGNTAIGQNSLPVVTSSNLCTGIGGDSLLNLTTGANNTAIGYSSGNGLTTGANNTFIGLSTAANTGSLAYSIAIGSNARTYTSNTAVIGGQAPGTQIDSLFIGSGAKSSALITTAYLRATAANTTVDLGGTNLGLCGGSPLGTGKSGDIVLNGYDRNLSSGTGLPNEIEQCRIRGSAISTTTATTTIIDSYTTSSNKTTTFNVRVIAKGTTTDSAFYNFVATFNNNGGTVTQVGTTIKLVEHETVGGWDMDFNINGTSVETRVISTAMNISWVMSAEIFTV